MTPDDLRIGRQLGLIADLWQACVRETRSCAHVGCNDNNHVEGCPALVDQQDRAACIEKLRGL